MKRFKFFNYNLPITFCYKYFGELIKQENNKYVVKLKGSYISTILEFIYTSHNKEYLISIALVFIKVYSLTAALAICVVLFSFYGS